MLSFGLIVVSLIWVIACGVLVILPGTDMTEAQVGLYSGYLQIFSTIAASLLCFRTLFFSFQPGDPMRKVWGFLGSGVLAWGIGSMLYIGYQLTHPGEEAPYPWFSDIGYLLMPVLIIISLISFQRALQVPVPRWGIVAGIGVFIAAASLSFWVSKGNLEYAETTLAYAVQMASIILDPALLGMTVLSASLLAGGLAAVPWWFGLAGLVLYYLGNLGYYLLIAQEQYVSGGLVDLAWPLAFGLIGVAAMLTYNLFKMLEE